MNKNMEKVIKMLENTTHGNATEMADEFAGSVALSFAKTCEYFDEARELQDAFEIVANTQPFIKDNFSAVKAGCSLLDGVDAALEKSFDSYIAVSVQLAISKACKEWAEIAAENGFDRLP